MAPITQASDEHNHQDLLEKLDIYKIYKPFRRSTWKPAQRRNKTVKQIISDAARREASIMATPTQNNSGSSTPMPAPSDAGSATPSSSTGQGHARDERNLAAAAQRLDRLVLERNLQKEAAAQAQAQSLGVPLNGNGNGNEGGIVNGSSTPAQLLQQQPSGPLVTYTNIESAPSLHPSSQRRYCDVTGLSAPYTDPKTRLRYHNVEIFGLIRGLPQTATESLLEARGAHMVLK